MQTLRLPLGANNGYAAIIDVAPIDGPMHLEIEVNKNADHTRLLRAQFFKLGAFFFIVSFIFVLLLSLSRFFINDMINRHFYASMEAAFKHNKNCTALYVGTGFTVGAIVILIALPIILFPILGLGVAGPIAGGWFALNMGAGLSAGSAMALLQSMAMGGSLVAANAIVAIGTLLGGSAGALSAAGIMQLLKDCGMQ